MLAHLYFKANPYSKAPCIWLAHGKLKQTLYKVDNYLPSLCFDAALLSQPKA